MNSHVVLEYDEGEEGCGFWNLSEFKTVCCVSTECGLHGRTKEVKVFLYDGWFINTLFFLLYHTLADRQTKRQRDRHAIRPNDWHADKQTGRKTAMQPDRLQCRQTERQTDRHADIQTDWPTQAE